MTKHTVPDLKELIKQASEIAQQVPENMQVAAFNRALDFLTAGASPSPPIVQKSNQKDLSQGTASKSLQPAAERASGDTLQTVIDSTQHPGIRSATTTLDRALMVLQIALQHHQVDGLTASEIAKLLTEKFRLGTTSNSVNMALGRATTLVNRVSNGSGYIYRIMGPGEEYLAHLNQSDQSSMRVSPPKTKKKRVAKVPRTEAGRVDKPSAKKVADKATKAQGNKSQAKNGVGPKSAILSLIDSGFLSQPKAIQEIITHLKNKRGLTFDSAQIAVAMLRLLRDQLIERDQNAEGQYEYKKPGA